jgi:hypothetical protein
MLKLLMVWLARFQKEIFAASNSQIQLKAIGSNCLGIRCPYKSQIRARSLISSRSSFIVGLEGAQMKTSPKV